MKSTAGCDNCVDKNEMIYRLANIKRKAEKVIDIRKNKQSLRYMLVDALDELEKSLEEA